MSPVVLKLFAGQGTGRTKRRLYAYFFGEHNNNELSINKGLYCVVVFDSLI